MYQQQSVAPQPIAGGGQQLQPMSYNTTTSVVPSTPATGGSSISQLVQALQAGNITKQQLYSSLTTMYKGGHGPQVSTPASTNISTSNLLGSPSSINSSFDTSFGLNSTGASIAPSPIQPSQPYQQQSTAAPSSFQPSTYPSQPSQQPPLHQQFPSFANPPTTIGGGQQQPTHAQAQAAQQQIQSFLSRHLNQSNNTTGLSSLNSSLLDSNNSSLNLSSNQSTPYGKNVPAASNNNQFQSHPALNFSHQQPQPQQRFSSPAVNHQFTPGSNMSGLDSYHGGQDAHGLSLQAMEDSMALLHQSEQRGQGQGQGHQTGQGQGQTYSQTNGGYSGDDNDEAQEYLGGGLGDDYYASSRHISAYSNMTNSDRPRNSARQSVRERMAQVYTDEKNKELTFKPTIHPLPRGLYSKHNEDASVNAPFLGRVMHWHENKRARERQRSVELEKKQLEECSFKPQLSPESIAIVAAPGASHRRLFSARSTARAKILELELKRKEEEEFRQNCTFNPELNRKSLHLAAGAGEKRRPLSAGPNSQQLTQQQQQPLGISASTKELKECTFQPKTNSLKKDMFAAQLYLEQNAFARLATVKPKPSSEDGYSSDDGGRGRSKKRGAKSARSASQDAHNRTASGTDASFDEFLARLKYKDYQREEKLNQLRLEEQKQYQYGRPMLSKTSAKIIKKSMEQGRYQSPSKTTVSRNADLVLVDGAGANGSPTSAAQQKLAWAMKSDPECTFAPTINPYSASLSRRSFHEMSQLELIRRTHNLEMAATEKLAAEMEEASFTPHLHRPPRAIQTAVDSRLKVVTEPELYLERLEFQRKLREAEIERQKRLREAEEVKECTFAPAVHESPAFVKRIAKSMEVTRANEMMQLAQQGQAAGGAKKKGGKPEWK